MAPPFRRRNDYTGARIGCVEVLEQRDLELEGRQIFGWRLRWGCCGKEETVPHGRVAIIAQTPPGVCRACHLAGKKAAPAAMQSVGALPKIPYTPMPRPRVNEIAAAEHELMQLQKRMARRLRDPDARYLRALNGQRVADALALGRARGPRGSI